VAEGGSDIISVVIRSTAAGNAVQYFGVQTSSQVLMLEPPLPPDIFHCEYEHRRRFAIICNAFAQNDGAAALCAGGGGVYRGFYGHSGDWIRRLCSRCGGACQPDSIDPIESDQALKTSVILGRPGVCGGCVDQILVAEQFKPA